jgi:hypothetical protein
MEELTRPFRLLDRSGRSLVWVMINDKRAHTVREFYHSPECHITVCPRRNGAGSPQDNTSRPCHSEGQDGFFRLKDEVHEWLANCGMERAYQFEFRYANDDREPGWHVGFHEYDKDKAAMFKLAWNKL